MDGNEASCVPKGNRDQGSEKFSKAFIYLYKFHRFSLYREITLCLQSLILFSIYFLGCSVPLLVCHRSLVMLSREYRAIVRKFLINHFLLGMTNAKLQRRRKTTLWLRHGVESSAIWDLFPAFTTHILTQGLPFPLNCLDWEVIKARILLPFFLSARYMKQR